jgi:predicted DNA-binding ribbon-helix-helix protein
MRPVNNRNEAETAQPHDKEKRLERSGHVDLAALENPFWQRVTLGLVELWGQGA